MANTLKKLGVVVYVPGVPPIPARPGYCVEERISEKDAARFPRGSNSFKGSIAPGTTKVTNQWGSSGAGDPIKYGYSIVEHNNNAPLHLTFGGTTTRSGGRTVTVLFGGNQNKTVTGGTSMARYDTRTVCFEGDPGRPGVPSKIIREDRVGWNGGARSIDSFPEDGYVRFTLPKKPNGVVIGLAREDTGGVFKDATHGVYAHGSAIEIVESGKVVATSGVHPNTQPTIWIKREGGYVDYFIGDWHYRSAVRSAGRVFLDAALYTTDDMVFDPAISSDLGTFTGANRGGVALVLAPLGINSGNVDKVGSLQMVLPALGVEISSAISESSYINTTLPTLTMFAGSGAGARTEIELPPLRINSESGIPMSSVGGGDVTLPPLYCGIVGKTGVVGGVEATLPKLSITSSDRTYGEARLSLGALSTYSDDGPPPGTYGVMQYVFTSDFAYLDPVLFATVFEDLTLQEAEASVVLAFQGTVFDGLMLRETLTITQVLQAIVHERLAVNSSTRQAALEAIQYAVNVATGALTTYQGFDFHGFARVGETTYGFRPDGLYKIRPGDDAGAGINAMVDFGVVPIERGEDAALTGKVHLHDAFLGLDSDGTAYMRLTPDGGTERVYRVVERRDVCRSRFGKGITAREWRVKLELIEATDATLDGIEYVAAISTRRWTR